MAIPNGKWHREYISGIPVSPSVAERIEEFLGKVEPESAAAAKIVVGQDATVIFYPPSHWESLVTPDEEGPGVQIAEPWQPHAEYRLGEIAVIKWNGHDVLLTCDRPGESGDNPPELEKVGPKGSGGYKTTLST